MLKSEIPDKSNTPNILEVESLGVSLFAQERAIEAVRGISFTIRNGETLGIVGESGCGKSMTAQAILGIIPKKLGMITGTIHFEGENLLSKTEKQMEEIRGQSISMIFQDPLTSLNPTMKIGEQILECLIKHKNLSRSIAKQKVLELLNRVEISNPDSRFHQYPFELSGGMRQRVMIAIALACEPKLIIADEPTTALDVTIQAQILDLLKKIKHQQQASMLLITHDLGVVAEMCDRVLVMYAGKIMEVGTVDQIFDSPQHPYTQALLRAIPKSGQGKENPLLPITGFPPDLTQPSQGCSFHPRCTKAMKVCEGYYPSHFNLQNGQQASCWLHHDFARKKL